MMMMMSFIVLAETKNRRQAPYIPLEGTYHKRLLEGLALMI
jgi:hypothetical protein